MSVFRCFFLLCLLNMQNATGILKLKGNWFWKEMNAFISKILFLILFRVLSNKKEILGLASISRILEILVVLFNKGLILIEESQFPKNKAKSLIVKAKSFMDLHYSDMHHQKHLEEECGVDINYLNIIFKKETGKTLYQYMTGVRMEHAKHLSRNFRNVDFRYCIKSWLSQ